MKKVSVIATVLNEEKTIQDLLLSLLKQTRTPDEIIITDGGSSDKTPLIIQEFISKGYPIKLLILPGCNISQGRNYAIKNAKEILLFLQMPVYI